MHAGKGLYSLRLEKHYSQYQTYFISLKPALAFQNLTLAMLSKWATSHERVSFMDKNCSWTLLPGSIWLQMQISRLHSAAFEVLEHFFNWFFETCWWLPGWSTLRDASQPPGRYARYLKTMRKILVDRVLMHHISSLFDGTCISFGTR